MSYEAESAVLGSMILDNECISLICEILHVDMFQDPTHKIIFDGCIRLNDAGTPIDLLQVRNFGVDLHTVEQVGESVPHAASAEHYAKIVLETYKVTRLNELSAKIQMIANSGDNPDDMIAEVQKSVTEHTEHDDRKEIDHVADVGKSIVFKKGGSERIPTGFQAIDDIIIGLYKTDYMVIGGRPGMGKTALMADIAVNMSWGSGFPVAFYSCEMSQEEIVSRMASARSGVSLFKVEMGHASAVEIEKLYEAVRQMENCPMYVKKTPALTPSALRRKVSSDKRKYGIKAAFVDYIQIMRPDIKGSKYETLSDTSEALKRIPIEFEVPLIVGSQLNRSVDKRDVKKPNLTDFRDTGAIEEHATIVVGLHRPSYYTPEEPDDMAEAIFLKARAYGTGTAKLKFEGKLTHFTDRLWMG